MSNSGAEAQETKQLLAENTPQASSPKPVETVGGLEIAKRTASIPWNVTASFMALGFTLGLFVGWSTSPVTGSVLTGLLGIISGGSVLFYVSKEGKNSEPLSGGQLRETANGLIAFCAATLIGTVVGINIRNQNLLFWQTKPIDIAARSTSLSPGVTAKLVLLQQRMLDSGVSPRKANYIIEKYISKCNEPSPLASEQFPFLPQNPASASLYKVNRYVEICTDLIQALEKNKEALKTAKPESWHPWPPPLAPPVRGTTTAKRQIPNTRPIPAPGVGRHYTLATPDDLALTGERFRAEVDQFPGNMWMEIRQLEQVILAMKYRSIEDELQSLLELWSKGDSSVGRQERSVSPPS